MNIALLYLQVAKLSPGFEVSPVSTDDLAAAARRWVASYKLFPPGIEHELVIGFCNGEPTAEMLSIYRELPFSYRTYYGGGWDLGAQQELAGTIDADFMVTMTSRSYFWKAGWLRRLADTYAKFGDGIYAAMASQESSPIPGYPFPNPHLRTSCYGVNPKTFHAMPFKVKSREDTFNLESGEHNIARWYESQNKPALMVTWDGFYSRPLWTRAANTFRKGDQSNCLVWDRHTEIYSNADATYKQELSQRSYGL